MTDSMSATFEAFNNCINERDLEALSSLMTDDHTFIDSASGVVSGKQACIDAWKGFFAAFPDYRNDPERIVPNGNKVVAIGHSHCSDERLAGPAIWQAMITGNRVAEWRVFEDTPANRLALGIAR